MFTLKSRKDGFRLLLPNGFLPKEIEEKYSKVLMDNHSFIVKPLDFINETIQGVAAFGFNDMTMQQEQLRYYQDSKSEMPLGNANFNYRAFTNPEALLDRTLTVTFRHTLGYLNYFILMETAFKQYHRDTTYDQLPDAFYLEMSNEHGAVYARVKLSNPMIDGIDMITLNYTAPVAESDTFNVIFKYTDYEYEFITQDAQSVRDVD